jgi:hypothetical protein
LLMRRTSCSARRWCWRQSAGSSARGDTFDILVTVEGHHETAELEVKLALAKLKTLLVAHAEPTTLRTDMLSAGQPAFGQSPRSVHQPAGAPEQPEIDSNCSSCRQHSGPPPA